MLHTRALSAASSQTDLGDQRREDEQMGTPLKRPCAHGIPSPQGGKLFEPTTSYLLKVEQQLNKIKGRSSAKVGLDAMSQRVTCVH